MAVSTIQSAFSAGEIAPELYGEVDLQKFSAAATTLRNLYVNYRGGACSRGGLAFVGRCKQPATSAPPRPVPFQFSNNQGYALEFGDNYLRFVFQGGYVLENAISITGATQANPCQISAVNTFSNGDWVFIAGIGGMTQLNGNTYVVANAAGTHFTLQDLNGNAVNSTGYGLYTAGGTVSRIYTLSTPYAAVDLPYLKFSQTADVMSLTCSNPVTGTEYPPYELTRLASNSWTLQLTDFSPAISPPATISASANTQAPTNGTNATFAYVVTAVDSSGHESVASGVATCHGADLQVEAGANTVTWSASAGAAYYNVYRGPVAVDNGQGASATANDVPAGSIYGFVGSAYGTQFVDNNVTPTLSQTPPLHRNPFARGQIEAVTITGGGSGQTVITSAVTTAAGVNFAGTPFLSGGSLGGFQVTNPGSGYAPGDSIAFNGAGFASGAVEFGSTNPSAGDTITLNGVVWTFVSSVTGSNQTLIGGSLAITLNALAAGLSASGNTSLNVASYALDVTQSNLLITYNTAGAGGNSYTLAASRATVSGGTLTGGSGSGSAGTHATGSLSFPGNPLAGTHITLNGVDWTFVSSGAAGNQTNIQASLMATLTQLASDLNASVNASISKSSYVGTSTQLNVTYKTVGAAGNTYTLSVGNCGSTASGTLTFSGNPTNGQTIVLNGVTWTFVTSGASGSQTNIGASLAATLTQLVTDLTGSANTSINVANYTASTTVLTATYKTVGTGGNAYTLAGGTSGATPSGATLTGGGVVTESGPNLTGGTDAATTPTGTLVIGPTTGTYPGVNCYFQQRHFFANSFNSPDTLWASQTGLYKNFDTAIPTVATDAITASPWTEQVNGIQWLIPMPGGLIAMTGLRAWQVVGEGSYQLNAQPITPSTTQAQPQAFNGCSATIPPIVIDYDVLYVQAIGNTTVFDLSWNFWVNIYTGNDLTILSSHLFLYRSIVQWAWARQPYKVLWAACDDGTMISLTFLKEQQVYGWARHDTQGLVMGVCSVTEPPVNAIYAVVKRFPPYAPSGIYVMERMDNRIWQTVEDTFAVDSAVANPMTSPAASLTASAASGAGVTFTASASAFTAASVGEYIRLSGGIAHVTAYTDTTHVVGTWVLGANPGPAGVPYAPSGAWTIAAAVTSLNAPHLAGMSVVGLADGVPIGPIAVSGSGTITLPFAASNVKAGLSFTAQVQTAYLNGEGAVQGARKVIPAATFRLAATGNGFQTGTNQPDGAAQNPPQIAPAWTGLATGDTTKPTGGQTGAATYQNPAGQTVTQLWTGDLRVVGGGAGWVSRGQVAIQQTQPLPLQVLAVMPEVLPGDMPEVAYKPEPQGRQAPRGPGRWMIGREAT